MTDKVTAKIKIWGIVQGVGFRPFAAKLADSMKMSGEVFNTGGLVEMTVTDTKEKINRFVEALKKEKPTPAEIIHIDKSYVEYREFDGFTIAGSTDGEDETAMLPSDLSVCDNCLREMRDEKNERYGHPFISCMACGPRYAIINKMPYDRDNTSMTDFKMCAFCENEYTDRTDRRYHAQTISCHHCGPQIAFRSFDGHTVTGTAEEMTADAVRRINNGEVIAVKGAGGYNLICDPFRDKAVSTLREIKNRERKPFAVMFLNTEQIEAYCEINQTERSLVESSAKPILLLERKSSISDIPYELKKSRLIGAFLPSMGLHYLLLEWCGRPLIVTSANVSGLPMIKDDANMFAAASRLQGLIAGTFFNEREIIAAVDDSVVRVIDGRPQMIRRSKGYAPVPLYAGSLGGALDKRDMTLACGGQLKNSFALSKGAFSYISQYFGDLDSRENMRVYEESLARMKKLFGIKPSVVICDAHPLYATTKYAKRYAKEHNIELIKVQHHHAHVASVMAEHGITDAIIGVSFDGTGYGTDGRIWGGEFLLCEGSGFKRAAHLKYIKMTGGDSSVKSAVKSAISYVLAFDAGAFSEIAEDEVVIDIADIIAASDIRQNTKFNILKSAIENGVNTVESSSMGRLFDAVSSLLGICDENSYEGECAILLEDAATRALKAPGRSKRDDLALKFHFLVAEMILTRCVKIREREKTNKVAITGGVFQNRILMEKTLALLRSDGFDVYYNISVSPNDGGIALGQSFIGMNKLVGR